MYTAPISSTGEGAIRAQEAQLVADFITRARQVEPQGRVVVSENGEIANILLEPNDTIVIPEVTDLIHVGGEVLLPQSVVFNPDATTEDYVAWAGGFTERAEDERIRGPQPDRIGVPRHRATIGDPSNPCRHAEYDPGEAVAKPFHRRDRFVDTATNVPTS